MKMEEDLSGNWSPHFYKEERHLFYCNFTWQKKHEVAK